MGWRDWRSWGGASISLRRGVRSHPHIAGRARKGKGLTQNLSLNNAERVSLCETLDRILNKGAVVVGEVTISVANIDLIYLGLHLILTSIEGARDKTSARMPLIEGL